ncbi:VPLPA-CTERM sorting domain-containing protein [uncultured Roseobacter sp.]|uniref:VPLPA-CTERM sorting domain-containing protein n=1 Tax=uncultured Roseobacter sp. TaxID=114847 RepID=UPI00260396A2|nr:VPLPA-CTERM sorting domain-containing protein [uncultured Roseobacter sp.]
MIRSLKTGAMITALLMAFAAPVAAKTISFTGLFEAENYPGGSSPFAEQPATLDMVIEIDPEVQPETYQEVPGNGSISAYSSAVTSFTYEAFGAGGASLGLWSVADLSMGVIDTPIENIDLFTVQSNTVTGPAPLETLLMFIEGDTNIFSGSGLDQLTTQTLQAMHTGRIDLFTEVDGMGFGIRFAIDFDSIEVVDDMSSGDTPPSAVPLPASLPLVLAAFGALGMAKRRKDRA